MSSGRQNRRAYADRIGKLALAKSTGTESACFAEGMKCELCGIHVRSGDRLDAWWIAWSPHGARRARCDVPMLTLLFGMQMGASLMAVIATSSGAAAAYVKDGLTNIRIGMFLELATNGSSAPFATADFSALCPAAALAGSNEPVLIIRLGLFLLVATPVALVALWAIAFAVEVDHVYSGISALVLAVLLYSIFGLH